VSDGAAILDYWLGPEDQRDAPAAALRQRWFEKSDATDAHIQGAFGADVERAVRGELGEWAETARGRLGVVILLDQFTRNIHRGSARAFAGDALALALAQHGLDLQHDRALKAAERFFLYMPLVHSERLSDQERAVLLFDDLARAAPVLDARSYAKAHRDIVARFGRFPHRNLVLGRTSTAEELEFLSQPGSAF
jgi:uncharacterized protein (DUF924 family)